MATSYKVLGQVVPYTYSVSFGSSTVSLTAHGLANGTPVSFPTVVTTTGIIINTTYFVVNAATDSFQISLTVGGTAVTFVTAGTGTMITTTTLYSVPGSTSAVVSTLSICNQGISGTIRVAVRPAGAVLSAKHYILYDASINANDSLFFTLGISLATTDVITVYASNAGMSFNLYGTEIV